MPNGDRETLWLIKGNEQFIIRYELGDEEAVYAQLNLMVANPRLNFDNFDRRVLLKKLIDNASHS